MPLIYKMDVIAALKEAGYNRTYIRENHLLSESTLTKLKNGNMGITLKSLGTICDFLNCQPGDILEYIKD